MSLDSSILIEEMTVNEDHWRDGFVTYTYGDEE